MFEGMKKSGKWSLSWNDRVAKAIYTSVTHGLEQE